MKFYIKIYDELFDEQFQSEIDEDTYRDALKVGAIVQAGSPFSGLEIKSQYRSDGHPGWDHDGEAGEAT